MTWKRAVADELARSHRAGQNFTLRRFSARATARMQALGPADTTARDKQFAVELGGRYELEPRVIAAAADRLAHYHGVDE